MRISGEIDFPPETGGFVYIFYFVNDNVKIPFYAGEALSFHARMTDYIRKQFSCTTDFNVGTAAEYLRSKGRPVKVRYWQAKNRKWEETQEILELRGKGYPLLNKQLGYRYRTANRMQQQSRIHAFVDTVFLLLHRGEEGWANPVF
ncbi:MAG: hypothetical protein WBZ11_13685 [Candidatus Sulfotelmatobacter sp.]|jgi:hypothetical protein